MEISKNEGLNTGMEKTSKERKDGGVATRFGWPEVVLRVLAMVLTLTAAILLGLDKQTKLVSVTITPDLPAINVPVIAKYHYASAYVYFVVGNAIACAFAAVSLALTFISNGGGKIVSRLMIIVADLMMVALLFSSIGAATGIGLIGIKGNSHLQWHKVCDVFGRFCHQVMASVALSLLAAIAFLLLIILAASKLQKRTY
ncbi:hypothetical protein BVRB_7g157780 [Beta vulgaris subsp. vulgaris]|uniref:CASP-like protein 1E1 isoform X1 n=1 Tax=Beta vulgaris subsp. vulgaris TaxID=3555 RepID=UPI00053F4D16|nr:CASP-like protein 1E1 isoform X1 [Beta vulgaris subsp. vulgaris]KMT06610.1 hypothetical protein BVRB_7g157780 [Beta vulgaris subsp. vulgaris]